MNGASTIHVDAPPEAAYALVSDVTRIGELSPECVGAEWLDGATGPAEGARFKGHNRRGWWKWSMKVPVLAADPPREFAFRTNETVWRYRFEPAAGGTDV